MNQPDESRAAVVLTTLGDRARAEALAREVVQAGLAACVNLVSVARSIYRWKGRIEEDEEVLLLIKTAGDRVEALKERIASLHPYELPEILIMDVREGSPDYLAWIRAETRTPLEER